MGAEAFDPLAILRILNEHELEYAVVGGFAVASYGVVRATEDLDLVIDRGQDNARKLARALAELEAQRSAGDVPATPEALVRQVDLRFDTRFGALHILREVDGIPTYRDLESERVAVEQVEFSRPTLAALRRMKHAAGRDKDRVDLAELDALGEDGPA